MSSEEDYSTTATSVGVEESRWLVACHKGELKQMQSLLENSPQLLDHRDFVYGYTALHWAAKLGRRDMVELVHFRHSNDSKEYLEMKSFGGYTALHIASISGKEGVIVRLLELGADIHARDHGGRKAKDMVKNTISANVQRRLGRPLVIDTNTVLKTGLSIHTSKTTTTKSRAPRFSLAGLSGGELAGSRTDDTGKKRNKSVGAKCTPTIVLT